MNTKEVLQELISKPYTPFTVCALKEEIELAIKQVLAQKSNEDPKNIVVFVLNERFKSLVQALNLPLLQEILVAIKRKVLDKTQFDENIRISVTASPEEVSEFCTKIHQELQRLQSYKEEITHFMSFFTQAKGYVASFASSAEIILREYFEGRKEFKQQKDALLNDAEVYKDYFSAMLKELNSILDDVLAPRMNLALRMESSLRLLERYRDPTLRGFTIHT